MGCYCWLPMKVKFEAVTCWLHEQGVTAMGWPVELDGP